MISTTTTQLLTTAKDNAPGLITINVYHVMENYFFLIS